MVFDGFQKIGDVINLHDLFEMEWFMDHKIITDVVNLGDFFDFFLFCVNFWMCQEGVENVFEIPVAPKPCDEMGEEAWAEDERGLVV